MRNTATPGSRSSVESTVTLLPLREYSPGSSAARDYRALAAELMEEV